MWAESAKENLKKCGWNIYLKAVLHWSYIHSIAHGIYRN